MGYSHVKIPLHFRIILDAVLLYLYTKLLLYSMCIINITKNLGPLSTYSDSRDIQIFRSLCYELQRLPFSIISSLYLGKLNTIIQAQAVIYS